MGQRTINTLLRSRTAKVSGTALLLVIVASIAIVGGLAFYAGRSAPPLQVAQAPTVTQVPAPPGAVPYFGSITLSVTAQTPFNTTTTPAETSPLYEVYNILDGKDYTLWTKADLSLDGTFDAATTRTIKPTDKGQLAIRVYPGTAHYLAIGSTAKANLEVVGARLNIDIDDDGELDTIYQVDYSAISSIDPNLAPARSFKVVMTSDAGTTNDYLNSPANDGTTASGVGTADTWRTVNWEDTIPRFTSRSYAIQELLSNRTGASQTFTSEFRLSWAGMSMEGPYGMSPLSRADMVAGIRKSSSFAVSTHDAGSGLIKVPDFLTNPNTAAKAKNHLSANQAILVYMNPNQDTSIMRFSWQLRVDFGSDNDGETFTLRNHFITPAGGLVALVAETSANQDAVGIVA